MGMLACALVAFPVALAADVGPGFQTAAQRGPLGDPRPASDSNNRYVAVPATLGASGTEPHDTTLSAQILHDAGDPAALSTGAGPQANLPSGPLGIPGIVLDAYTHAADVLRVEQPNCHLAWWLLAGIGKIESGQAENGMVDANGTTLRPILGPVLDGSNGFAAIPATDGGRWTGNPVWQQAVGPMQFLPSTWPAYGGNGNPNNVYDAAIAAGRYLCHSGLDLSVPANQAIAVFNYNHSDSYVRTVLIWADAYAKGVTPLPETSLPLGAPAQGPLPVGVTAVPVTTPVTTPGAPPVIVQLPGGGTTTVTTPPPDGTGTTTPTAPGGTTTTTTTTTNPPTTTTTTTTNTSTDTPTKPPTCDSTMPTTTTDTTPPPTDPSSTPTPGPCATPTPAAAPNVAGPNDGTPSGTPTPTP